jgi:UDP-N-acetylmuramate dehydrogenase
MRLGGPARYLAHVTDKDEIEEAVSWAAERRLPVLMIGGGANIIFADEGYPGLVLVNDIKGITIKPAGKTHLLHTGAGEIWDAVVARSVEQGLTGIESLTLIPGKAGAAVVQNIGAYGQEVAQTLVEVEAFDTQKLAFVTIPAAECAFAYRSSRFNRQDKGRFFITALMFRLQKANPKPPFYKDVDQYLNGQAHNKVTPAVIREAVRVIRTRKLPDPTHVANAGSFFYNPIIPAGQFHELAARHPELNEVPPGWSQPPRWFLSDGQVKISAGRLIEMAGFKAYDDPETGMAVWPTQNLVLINKHARSTADLLRFRQKITDKVKTMFGIDLVQEPELIGAAHAEP